MNDRPKDADFPGELLRQGSLRPCGTGRIAIAGQLLALCGFFDARFRRIAKRYSAAEHSYPGILSVDTLRRLEYFAAFPRLATFASHFESAAAAEEFGRHPDPRQIRLAKPECVLSPAVCFHTYEFLEGGCLPWRPFCVTAEGRCHRFEGGELTNTPERLWSFRMREIVFFGSSQEVEGLRRRLMRAVERLAAGCGIPGRIEEATDPFFLGSSRGKALLQKLRQLKHELRAGSPAASDLALASFNHHEDFFGKRMDIRLPDGETAHSGCVAFGLERWAWTFLGHNGLDPTHWPLEVARYCHKHALG